MGNLFSNTSIAEVRFVACARKGENDSKGQ